MNGPTTSRANADHALATWLLGLGGLLLAVVSAVPYAGGWNDGSRLATVESLVERNTLVIDDSIFCRPHEAIARGYPPYPPDDALLLEYGTLDKLQIGGHFYSDKPAVISCLMAIIYQVGQWAGLPRVAERPDLFCWLMTVATSGLAYIVALVSLNRLGLVVGLAQHTRWLWLASFALATVAATYTRHVNNHIMLLGVIAALCLQLVYLARDAESGAVSRWRLLGLGTLAGLAYNFDLGAGPLLVVGVLALILYRCRRFSAATLFVLGALPWLAAGLGVNYAIGGVWKPMNMVPEYSAWPGGPFSAENLTGFARHGPLRLPVYSLAMLFGKKGFLCYNLPLLLALPATFYFCSRRFAERAELICVVGWCGAVWLLYSVLSNNYSGACCSIRWFVPFLAPGYFLLAVHLRDHPEHRPDFLVLSSWGAALATLLWTKGPWAQRMSPFLWPIVGAALLSWMACGFRRRRLAGSTGVSDRETSKPLAA